MTHYDKEREELGYSEQLIDKCQLCGQQSDDLHNQTCNDCIAEMEHGELFSEIDSLVNNITLL